MKSALGDFKGGVKAEIECSIYDTLMTLYIKYITCRAEQKGEVEKQGFPYKKKTTI